MDKISAALDSPIGRLVDSASPKIGAVTATVAGTSVTITGAATLKAAVLQG